MEYVLDEILFAVAHLGFWFAIIGMVAAALGTRYRGRKGEFDE